MNRKVSNILSATGCIALLCLGTSLALWAVIGGAVAYMESNPMTWTGFVTRLTLGGGAIGAVISWGHYILKRFEDS